jgi:hypothetical protein
MFSTPKEDQMTDISQFPEEVQARIEDLDRRIEGARAEEEDHQRALSRLQNDLAQSMALRKAVFETAEIFLRNVPDLRKTVFNPDWIDQAENAAANAALGRKVSGPRASKRRDIRSEVLEAVRITGPTTVSSIVAGMNCQRKQVEAALAYHDRGGRVAESPAGVWSVAAPQASAAAPSQKIVLTKAGWMPEAMARQIKDPTLDEPAPTERAPSADHVLNFIIRAGDMGVSDGQLETIGATEPILAILRHNESAAKGDDGRWRAAEAAAPLPDNYKPDYRAIFETAEDET